MFEKIKSYQNYPMVTQFRDVRVVGLWVFVLLVLMVSWSGIKAIQTNYELQKQISRLEQQNEVHRLENENLKLKNRYLETDEFLELSARRQFGKAAPGETVLLVPKNVALAHTVELPKKDQATRRRAEAQSRYEKNFRAWMDFFLHRETVSD